jgi:hypothetical protein
VGRNRSEEDIGVVVKALKMTVPFFYRVDNAVLSEVVRAIHQLSHCGSCN